MVLGRLTVFPRAGYAVVMSPLRVVAVVVAVLTSGCAGCLPRPGPCSVENCAGCCDASGACQRGNDANACGRSGASCSACASDQTCSELRCETNDADGGSTTSQCEVPRNVDFGVVALNDTASRQLTFENTTSETQTAVITWTNASGYTVSPVGTISVAPGATQHLDIGFTATQLGGNFAMLSVQRGAKCAVVNVRLAAQVVEHVLVVTPEAVDFGYAPPQATAKRTVLLENPGHTEVRVSNLATASPFAVVGRTSLTIAPASSTSVELSFRPTVLGVRTGTLTFSTDAFDQPTVTVPLRGVGGGPLIEVASPLTLPVTAVGSTQTAQLVVRNGGLRPSPADPMWNLRFGQPAYSLVFLGSTTASDFSVALSPAYDPTQGIESSRSTSLTVSFTPSSAGMKSAELHLFTNDLSTPDAVVILNATAVPTTACTYSVTPGSTVDFGHARPGTPLDWPVIVTNTGTTDCRVLDASVANSTYFSVQNFADTQLVPGASTVIRVRYTPPPTPSPTVLTFTGTLRIQTTSLAAPTTDVALLGAFGPNCLLTLPSLDFAAAPVGCRTAPVRLSVINTCASPVTVSTASLAAPSTVFTLPTSAGGVVAATAVHDFVAQYQPTSAGADDAMLVFTSVQSGTTVRHVVSLRGRGIAASTTTDTFPVTNRDGLLLLVIDNSSSMAAKQADLAVAVPLFLSSSMSSTAGLNIGVITTDLSDPNRGLLRRTATGSTYVQSGTPFTAGQLSELVQVGTDGGVASSCLEPANLALSDTYVHTVAGNLVLGPSPDSAFGVVCVTDSPDLTPNPVSYELARLSLATNKRRPELFSYGVMGPFLPVPPSGCSYDGVNNSVHDDALTHFRGVREEICTSQWVGTLLRIRDRIIDTPSVAYTLSRTVDATNPALSVSVNGTVVPEVVNGTTTWTFDAVRNQLRFTLTPEIGTDVAVSYAPLCF